MDDAQFQAEKLYQAAHAIAETMLRRSLITEEEYGEIDTILLQKYAPLLGTLLSRSPLT